MCPRDDHGPRGNGSEEALNPAGCAREPPIKGTVEPGALWAACVQFRVRGLRDHDKRYDAGARGGSCRTEKYFDVTYCGVGTYIVSLRILWVGFGGVCWW